MHTCDEHPYLANDICSLVQSSPAKGVSAVECAGLQGLLSTSVGCEPLLRPGEQTCLHPSKTVHSQRSGILCLGNKFEASSPQSSTSLASQSSQCGNHSHLRPRRLSTLHLHSHRRPQSSLMGENLGDCLLSCSGCMPPRHAVYGSCCELLKFPHQSLPGVYAACALRIDVTSVYYRVLLYGFRSCSQPDWI